MAIVPSTEIDELQQTLKASLKLDFISGYLAPATYCLQCMDYDLAIVFFACSANTQLEIDNNATKATRVVYIYEDDWIRKRETIIGRLKAYVGSATRIYARECVLTRLHKQETIQFLQQNHLQVPLVGKYRYGLRHKGGLVAVAVFSGARRMYREHGAKYRSLELIRNCNINGHVVVGGLSKLLKHFVRDFRPDNIMTYVDRDWSDGTSFAKLGFELVGTIAPQGFWVNRRSWERKAENSMELDCIDEGDYYYLQNRGSLKMVYHA